ncbi:MAG: hypothetical protein ACTHOK_08140, partial [Nocardioidaceae bacterium]
MPDGRRFEDHFPSARRPTPAPADPPPQPDRPMPVETTPAADNAVTRGERLPVRRQWRLLAPLQLFGALA